MITLLAALSCAATEPSIATATGFGGFSVRPAEVNAADPATRAYFKLKLHPGAIFTGHVVVSNPERVPVQLKVYSVDGLTGVTSGAVYANLMDMLRKAGTWVSPSVSFLTLAPYSQRRVAFEVRVPPDANAGDHLAGVAFENAHPQRTKGRFSITEVFRVVIGVDVRVPGAAAAAIRLTKAEITALPGTNVASVVIGLANSGTLLCKPRLTVSLRGAGRARTISRTLDTILPGDSIPYPFAWPSALARGEYRVRISATDCGRAVSLVTTARAGAPLIGTDHSATVTQAPRTRTVVPWWLFALAGAGGLLSGLLIGLLLFALARRRIRAKREIASAGRLRR